MALLFIDGFDHYDSTRIPQKWTSSLNVDITGPGRFASAGCIQVGSSAGGFAARVIDTPYQHWVVGMGFYITTPDLIGNRIFAINDGVGNGLQMQVWHTAEGRIQIQGGDGTVLGTSNANVVNAQNWHYIELEVVINPAAGVPVGSYKVRVDGLVAPGLPDATGVKTQYTANPSADTLVLGGVATVGSHLINIDDVYVLDADRGGIDTGLLGPMRVQTVFPTSDGSLEQWTMSPDQGVGNHWKNVNQNPPDDDTTYNFTGAGSLVDTFHFAPLALGFSILGVQLVADARKDDSAARDITTVYRIGGVNYVLSQVLSDTYRFYMDTRDANPATSLAWTEADVNALEAGYES